MIIFNEYKFAQEMLNRGFKKNMSSAELIVLAKYFRYIGKNEDQITDDLNIFCAKHFDGFNPIISCNKIKHVVQNSKKYPLVIPKPVPITQNEIDIIKGLNDYKSEKVIFILLVIAKHLKLNVGITDYYANVKRTEMFTMAKVHTTKDEKNNIINNLDQQTGLIDTQLFGGRSSCSFLITFVDEDGDAIFYVDEFDNIIGFYPHYCSECGKEINKKWSNHEFCNECRTYKNKEIKRNWKSKQK